MYFSPVQLPVFRLRCLLFQKYNYKKKEKKKGKGDGWSDMLCKCQMYVGCPVVDGGAARYGVRGTFQVPTETT